MAESRELAGWEQIARYLGVSPPTARNYWKKHGLPVIERGQRRYYAYTDALDDWKRSPSLPAGLETPDAGSDRAASIPPFEKTRRRWGILAVAFLAASVGLWRLALSRPEPVARLQLRNDAIAALAENGDELWRFPIPQDQVVSHHISPSLLDIDGSGREEVLVALENQNQEVEAGRLVCLSADGEVRWQFHHTYDFHLPGRNFVSYFTAHRLRWLGETSVGPLILLVTGHATWFPARVVLLEPLTGALVSEYLHPGHIASTELVDLDGDGWDELLLGGINNPGDGPGHPSLAVLDIPFAASDSKRENYFGAYNAKERKYLLFPRSDVYAQAELVLVREIHVQSADRILATLNANKKVIHYYLDGKLGLIAAHPSDYAKLAHDQMFAEGILDHAFGPDENQALQRVLERPSAPDGNSEQVRRELVSVEG